MLSQLLEKMTHFIRMYYAIWNILLIFVTANAYAKTAIHASFLNDITTNNVFVTYFSPQCQFSQHFLNVLEKIDLENLPTVGTALKNHLINCQDETDMCVDQQVKFYPSIRFHLLGQTEPLIFRGARTPAAVGSFLSKALLSNLDLANADEPEVPAPPESTSGVLQLTDENFESQTAHGPVFVKFYTNWCPHCKQLEPLFPQLAPGAKKLGVALAGVDCESQADTCTRVGVPHYPLLALWANGRQLAVFDGENGLSGWMQFLQHQLDALTDDKRAAATEGIVPHWFQMVQPSSLTWDSFDSTAESSKFLFVKFFAPWCSHCQRLAPVWEKLAHEAAQEFGDQVTVSRVDCTQESSLCTRNEVNAYPTLLLFHRGRLVDNYRGLRDLPALTAFLRVAVKKVHADREEL